MILYKYVPFSDGIKILEGNSLLFSQPRTFNDPFDMPSYPDEPAEDLDAAIFGRLRTIAKNSAWAENTGILTNPYTRQCTDVGSLRRQAPRHGDRYRR